MLRFDSLYDEAARLGVRVEERRLSGSVCGYYYDACRLFFLMSIWLIISVYVRCAMSWFMLSIVMLLVGLIRVLRLAQGA